MMLLAFSIPFHWYAAQIFEIALFACALLKIVIEQKFRPNTTQMRWKWAYIMFMLLWFNALCGMIHTQNTSEGWNDVTQKLAFLLFPLFFMFSDISYLKKDRLRAIFYSLIAGLLILFLTYTIWAAFDVIFKGDNYTRFFNTKLIKFYPIHHSYISMYLSLAFAFCYVELFKHKELKIKIFAAIAMALFLVFTIFCESRAGIITLFLEIIMLLGWTIFIEKKKIIGVISLAIFLIMTGITIKFIPKAISRITATVEKVTDKYSNDARIVQLIGYKQVMTDNWLFGVGTGDKEDEIVKSYERYKEELVASIIPVKGVDKQTFEKNRDILLEEIAKKGEQHVQGDKITKFIIENAEKRYCETESVNEMCANYISVNGAISYKLNTHNQYFEEFIGTGILGLISLLCYFFVPIAIMIKSKKYSVIYLIFIMIISFNALFESIFQRQMAIIFFNFFNILLFNDLILDIKSKEKI